MFIQEYTSQTNSQKYNNKIFSTNTNMSLSTNNAYMSTTSTTHNNYANFRLLDLPQHTYNLIQLEKQSDKIKASAYALIWLEFILKNNDFKNINYIFENLEVEKLDEWSIVSILRTTAFASQNIPAWSFFLNRCKKTLINKETI